MLEQILIVVALSGSGAADRAIGAGYDASSPKVVYRSGLVSHKAVNWWDKRDGRSGLFAADEGGGKMPYVIKKGW